MAADSLIGGSEVVTDLGPLIMDTINEFLDDTQEDTIEITEIDDATVVQGVGANGEIQGVLVPSDTATTGTLTNGDFVIDIDLPANVGLAFEGLNEVVLGAEAAEFYAGEIEEGVPASDASEAADVLRATLDKAVDLVLDDADPNTVVRVVNILSEPEVTGADITITGSATSTTNDVVALNINKLGDTNTLVIENIDKAIIVGPGAVEVGDDTDALVVGDSRDQSITGNTGDDTLVGGGGDDSLTGGEGADVFGITAAGNLTITDFGEGDTIAFSIPGFDDATDVTDAIDSTVQEGEDTVVTFTDGSTVTLVGVNAADLTSDLFSFTI